MSVTARPKFCPECGVGLGEEDRFCGGCGGAVEGGAEAIPTVAAYPTERGEEGAKVRRGSGYGQFVVAFALLSAVGAYTFALSRRVASDASASAPALTAKKVPVPDRPSYFYRLHLDLSEMRDFTMVRIEIEDPDGRRTVDSRHRRHGDKFSVAARGKGDAVMWRVYYDGSLTQTVRANSDRRPL